MKTEIARRLSDELTDILAKLDGTVRLVQENCEEPDFLAYRRAAARAMAAVIDVTAGLYRRNPEVKPEKFEG